MGEKGGVRRQYTITSGVRYCVDLKPSDGKVSQASEERGKAAGCRVGC